MAHASLYVQSPLERLLADRLRLLCVNQINAVELPEAAAALDLGVTGVRSLLWDTDWPLDRAVRIAEALAVVTAEDIERLVPS